MTHPLADWTALSDTWREKTTAVPTPERTALEPRVRELRSRVERATQRQWLRLASEVAITLGFGVLAWSAMRDADPNGIRIAVTTALIACIVWTFALWNQRGAWRPVGASTNEFVRLSYARLRASRRAVIFVWIALALSVAFYGPVFFTRFAARAIEDGEWWRWGYFGSYVVLFLAWTYRERRRLSEETLFLDALSRELADD